MDVLKRTGSSSHLSSVSCWTSFLGLSFLLLLLSLCRPPFCLQVGSLVLLFRCRLLYFLFPPGFSAWRASSAGELLGVGGVRCGERQRGEEGDEQEGEETGEVRGETWAQWKSGLDGSGEQEPALESNSRGEQRRIMGG